VLVLRQFLEQPKPDSQLVALFHEAIQRPPSDDPDKDVAAMAVRLQPLSEQLTAALATTPPNRSADVRTLANAKAAEVTSQLLGGASFNTGRFFVALGIFGALLGAAIGTDIANLKSSPTALYALATTVFGVVVGFLGSEKS
jgi:hypothetical protein